MGEEVNVYAFVNIKSEGGKFMPNSINMVLNEFKVKVKEILGDRVKKIILYGSYARGDYNNNSDVDIMILTDLNFEEIEKYRDDISDIAFEIELKTGIMLSPIIKNAEEYSIRIKYIPFYKNVNKEGVII